MKEGSQAASVSSSGRGPSVARAAVASEDRRSWPSAAWAGCLDRGAPEPPCRALLRRARGRGPAGPTLLTSFTWSTRLTYRVTARLKSTSVDVVYIENRASHKGVEQPPWRLGDEGVDLPSLSRGPLAGESARPAPRGSRDDRISCGPVLTATGDSAAPRRRTPADGLTTVSSTSVSTGRRESQNHP